MSGKERRQFYRLPRFTLTLPPGFNNIAYQSYNSPKTLVVDKNIKRISDEADKYPI